MTEILIEKHINLKLMYREFLLFFCDIVFNYTANKKVQKVEDCRTKRIFHHSNNYSIYVCPVLTTDDSIQKSNYILSENVTAAPR